MYQFQEGMGPNRSRFVVSEYYDGNPSNLENYVELRQPSRLGLRLPGRLHDPQLCNGNGYFDMTGLRGRLFEATDSTRSVTFVNNHDTEGRGNGMDTFIRANLGYAIMHGRARLPLHLLARPLRRQRQHPAVLLHLLLGPRVPRARRRDRALGRLGTSTSSSARATSSRASTGTCLAGATSGSRRASAPTSTSTTTRARPATCGRTRRLGLHQRASEPATSSRARRPRGLRCPNPPARRTNAADRRQRRHGHAPGQGGLERSDQVSCSDKGQHIHVDVYLQDTTLTPTSACSTRTGTA